MRRKLHFIYFLPLLLLSFSTLAQIRISGRVTDNKDKPLKGVSVSLNNTLDGGTTDSAGNFSFETTETGNQSLVANDATHSTMGMPLVLAGGNISGLVLRMRTAVLDAVTITAGSFASSDRTKTVLKPLDIVTTAGSNGDVVKAMQMLPGTQQPGTENGLFIRGGDASEAAIVVDELVVQSAFVSGPPGVATRSRFGAFNFQGISFSSGGYGARYGQALSGLLELSSTDVADKSTVNLGVNMGGVYASGTKRWKKSSLDIGGNYNNLAPLYALASSNFNFYKIPVGGGVNARYVWEPNKNGIFKVSFSTTYAISGITVPNPFYGVSDTTPNAPVQPQKINYETKDNYYFAQVSYKQMYKNKYSLYTGASYSIDKTDNKFGKWPLKQDDYRGQMRIEGKDFISSKVNLLVGIEVQHFGLTKTDSIDHKFDETQVAAYTELEWTPIYWLAVRPGVRYEHSALLNTDNVAPRLSAAIKTSTNSQISLAGGMFYQNANSNYYIAGLMPGQQQAIHYIANWQYTKGDRTFRIEGYYKTYSKLVTDSINTQPLLFTRYRPYTSNTYYNNAGSGYAQGIEVFWRDKKSIKNADYWISYSFVDSRRQYENYPYQATPTFIAKHNLSVVGKYFVDKWHTNFSATYSFASGYPYYNPEAPLNKNTFLNDRTPTFNNVALTIAYLHTFGRWFSIFYMSIDNVLDTRNVYGYSYTYTNGVVNAGSKTEIRPALYRTIFVGANFSLTKFSKDEL